MPILRGHADSLLLGSLHLALMVSFIFLLALIIIKVDFLKGIAKTKARSKVFIYCLNKTYDQFKDVKP